LRSALILGALSIAVLGSIPQALACVGSDCLQIQSTADGGGALTLVYDFESKVQAFEVFCTENRVQCLYSTIDPGFRAETTAIEPYYPLRDGTAVRIEIVSADAPLTLSVNGQRLHAPGSSANIGVTPSVHTHPAWQLLVPGDEIGDFRISYRLTTDSPLYTASEVFTSVVTNIAPPPSPTSTPQVTPTPIACGGDCDADQQVTVDEIVRGVAIALGTVELAECPPSDTDHGGSVTVDELIQAVNTALTGCMATPKVTFAELQETIFSPRCALPMCHTGEQPTANLSLDPEESYEELINVVPDTLPAAAAGLLLVAAGEPERSFLLLKVEGPAGGQGSLMPLTGDPLTPDEIGRIRNWILQGAEQ
jgi:hypothetical protein